MSDLHGECTVATSGHKRHVRVEACFKADGSADKEDRLGASMAFQKCVGTKAVIAYEYQAWLQHMVNGGGRLSNTAE